MKSMRRVLAILLVVSCTLGLFSGLTVSAGAAYSKEDLENLVVQTALAYYYKGRDVQYDSYYITKGSRYIGSIIRQTNNRDPEDCGPDRIHYTVCSAFPHDVYRSAFGKHVINRDDTFFNTNAKYRSASYSQVYGADLTNQELDYLEAINNVTEEYVAYAKAAYEEKVKLGTANDGKGYAPYYFTPEMISAMGDPDTYFNDLFENDLRPGDILAVLNDSGGHTMMFIGDAFGDGNKYVIHSWGGKYNNNDAISSTDVTDGEPGESRYITVGGNTVIGYDTLEASGRWSLYTSGYGKTRNGSIMINKWNNMLGKRDNNTNGGYYVAGGARQFAVLRPLASWGAGDLTSSARARMEYPGLQITKTCSVNPYVDMKVDGSYTYTVRIENETADPYSNCEDKNYSDITVTEQIPANTTLVQDSVTEGGSYDADARTITWSNVAVAASGETRIKDLTYTVTVNHDTPIGTMITSPNGTVTGSAADGAFQTAQLQNIVGGAAYDVNFGSLTESSVSACAAENDTNLAENVYAAVGLDLDLPTVQEMIDGMYTPVIYDQETAYYQYNLKLSDADKIADPEMSALRKMLVPGYYGGQRVSTMDENDIRTNKGRLSEFKQSYLQPGDILIYGDTMPNTYRKLISSRNAKAATCTSVPSEILNYIAENPTACTAKLKSTTAENVTTVSVDDTEGTKYFNSKEDYTQYCDLAAQASALRSLYANNGSTVTSSKTYVYLGDGQYAAYTDEGQFTIIDAPTKDYIVGAEITVDDSGDTVPRDGETEARNKYRYSAVQTQAYLYGFFLCLRPSLTGAASTMTASDSHRVTVTTGSETRGYSTLSDAISHASAGDTVKLWEEVTLSGNLSVDRDITLDLGGYTLDTQNYSVTLNGSITVKNGTIQSSGNGPTVASGEVTLNNLKLYGGSGYALLAEDGASAALEAAELASAQAGQFPIQGSGSLTFTDDVSIAIPAALESTWNDAGITLGSQVVRYGSNQAGGVYMKFSGDETAEFDTTSGKQTAGTKYKVFTYTAHPACKNLSTDTSYASLSDALAAMASGNEIKLLTDVDCSALKEVGTMADGPTATYPLRTSNKSFALDFDAHTVTHKGGRSGLFLFRGTADTTVTLKNGKIAVAGSGMLAINTALGKQYLINMEITSCSNSIYISYNGSFEDTKMYVKNSTIMAGVHSGISSSVANYAYGVSAGYGELYLQDNSTIGSLSCPAVNLAEGAAMIAEDGRTLTNQRLYVSQGNTTVKEAAANSLTYPSWTTRTDAVRTTVTVDGQEVYLFATDYDGPKVKIGDQGYTTVQEAITAAQDGETLTVEDDLELTSSVTVKDGTTLNLGEHALTFTGEGKLNIRGTVKAPIAMETDNIVLEEGGEYIAQDTDKSYTISYPRTVPEDTEVHPDASVWAGTGSLSLEDGIRVNTYVDTTEHSDCDYTIQWIDEKEQVNVLETADTTAEQSFSLDKVAAKDMAKSYTFQVVAQKDGVLYAGRQQTFSIADYAKSQLQSNAAADDLLSQTIVSMLNYGAKAQEIFLPEAGDTVLDKAGITSAQLDNQLYKAEDDDFAAKRNSAPDVVSDPKKSSGSVYRGTSTMLEDKMSLRFYLKLKEEQKTNISATATYTDHNGKNVEKEYTSDKLGENGNFNYFQVPLAAGDISAEVTLTVKNGGTTLVTVTDSLSGYIKRAYGQAADYEKAADFYDDLLDSMLIYGLTTKAYFAEPVQDGDEMPIF